MTKQNSIVGNVLPRAGKPIQHPGQYVRDSVLAPTKLSVSAAAKLIGVGRPALSNFLNGHVSATQAMAKRIEMAFGFSKERLLTMQLLYDSDRSNTDKIASNVVRYMPILLRIQAKDIEDWSNSIESRSQLPNLLRILINSTNYGAITFIDFPANDNAQKHGWDGKICSTQATPWIPMRDSGWEMSVQKKNISQKASKDFEVRSKQFHKVAKDMTFVFVTTRNWLTKNKWIANCNSQGLWKEVRAYDASDLEQWIEQSITAQIWFAEKIGKPINGLRTLDKCWQDWANITEPPLVATFFESAINEYKDTFCEYLSSDSVYSVSIVADSAKEAFAFLSQLFGDLGGPELKKYQERIIVIDGTEVLSQISRCIESPIIVCDHRIIPKLSELAAKMHMIFIYPPNMIKDSARFQMILNKPSSKVFTKSLGEMKFRLSDILHYSHKSGRSLTVLRRQLAKVRTTCNPSWVSENQKKRACIPFLLAGGWDSNNENDKARLAELAGEPFSEKAYSELDNQLLRFVDQDDPPVWVSKSQRGVVSSVDLLHLISGSMTQADLKYYFKVALDVLQEKDQAISLSENEWFAALIKGNQKGHSKLLRNGISRMLPLLALYGKEFFGNRLGIDCQKEIDTLVGNLLTPLTLEGLINHKNELPIYAEAAPNKFLSILEKDLGYSESACVNLINSTTKRIHIQYHRVGLLWALEVLAWNKDTLLQSSLILAKLATIETQDDLQNKPINSLKSIFRIWMPQTSVDQEERLRVLNSILKNFPTVAWQICLNHVDLRRRQNGHYSYKPKWANYSLGIGDPISDIKEIEEAQKKSIGIMLNWPSKDSYDKTMLSDLVKYFDSFTKDQQKQIWSLINKWLDQNPTDTDKAFLADQIRINITPSQLSNVGRSIVKKLLETEPRYKYQWLFKDYANKSAGKKIRGVEDFYKHEELLEKNRIKALKEIYHKYGSKGIFEFSKMEISAKKLGISIGKIILVERDIFNFLLESWTASLNFQANSDLIKGMLSVICRNKSDKTTINILEKIKQELKDSDFAKFLLLAPFQCSVWWFVDQLDESARQIYWKDVVVGISSERKNTEIVNRLRSANRPYAAFTYISFDFESISVDLLFQLMCEIINTKEILSIDLIDEFFIRNALKPISQDQTITLEKKAKIEFLYIGFLSEIPNLEIYIELHPEFFVKCIVQSHVPQNAEGYPLEWKVQPESAGLLAKASYSVLGKFRQIPGCNELMQGKRVAQLQNWINSVRNTSKLALLGLDIDIVDVSIGKLLSYAPIGEDGIWPCESVREVLEKLQSNKIISSMFCERYNARGMTEVTSGKQELELAKQYRKWGESIMYEYPFVKLNLLDEFVNIYQRDADRTKALSKFQTS